MLHIQCQNIEETIKNTKFLIHFSFDYYSKDIGENGVSVYDNMTKIYNNCKRFCDNFDNETKGLVFYGSTGLGKTFLSSAIAKELMDKGKMVIYIRATKLFSINEDYSSAEIPTGLLLTIYIRLICL